MPASSWLHPQSAWPLETMFVRESDCGAIQASVRIGYHFNRQFGHAMLEAALRSEPITKNTSDGGVALLAPS